MAILWVVFRGNIVEWWCGRENYRKVLSSSFKSNCYFKDKRRRAAAKNDSHAPNSPFSLCCIYYSSIRTNLYNVRLMVHCLGGLAATLHGFRQYFSAYLKMLGIDSLHSTCKADVLPLCVCLIQRVPRKLHRTAFSDLTCVLALWQYALPAATSDGLKTGVRQQYSQTGVDIMVAQIIKQDDHGLQKIVLYFKDCPAQVNMKNCKKEGCPSIVNTWTLSRYTAYLVTVFPTMVRCRLYWFCTCCI